MEENKEQAEKALKQMYADMYAYMINKDTKQLIELLDSSFVLVHMTGMRQAKQDYLNYISRGTLNYYSAKHENVIIHFCKDSAELIGQSRVNAAVFSGGRHIWNLQQTIRLAEKNGRWYMTESVASTY